MEGDLVIRYLKAARSKSSQPFHTTVEIKDAPALRAVKMMMVSLVGSLIAGRMSGNLNTADLPLFLKDLERAIDRSDA